MLQALYEAMALALEVCLQNTTVVCNLTMSNYGEIIVKPIDAIGKFTDAEINAILPCMNHGNEIHGVITRLELGYHCRSGGQLAT